MKILILAMLFSASLFAQMENYDSEKNDEGQTVFNANTCIGGVKYYQDSHGREKLEGTNCSMEKIKEWRDCRNGKAYDKKGSKGKKIIKNDGTTEQGC